MAYNEKLAERIRPLLESTRGVTEKKMFGGLSFLVNGNMCVGIVGEEIIVRVHPDHHDGYVAKPHARIMDFTGKPMRGWIFVAPEGFKTKSQLQSWVQAGLDYVENLPKKK